MARPTGTFSVFEAIGIREDLKDFIANVAPKDVPFQNMAGKAKAYNTFVEWQTDTFAAAASNKQVEGDTVSTFIANAVPTVRLGNRTQISAKGIIVSGTLEATSRAGRASELAYQITKQTYELRRDMEFVLTQSQASTAGNATTARQLGSLENQITTNASNNGDTGGGWSSPNWQAVTDGTQRAFTESLLKTVVQTTYSAGGDPDYLMVGPAQKQVVSGFTGNATRFDKSEDKRLVTAIDVYVSDFGEFRVIPNRFQRNRTAFLLQSDLWQVAYLRPLQVLDIARTGDATQKELIVEYTLLGKNEAGNGIIRSLS